MLKPTLAVLQVLDTTVQTLVLSLEASQAAAAAAAVSGAALQRMLDGVGAAAAAAVVVLPVEVRAGCAPPSGRGSSTRSPLAVLLRASPAHQLSIASLASWRGTSCVPIEPDPKP
jgi:hypothetical protein